MTSTGSSWSTWRSRPWWRASCMQWPGCRQRCIGASEKRVCQGQMRRLQSRISFGLFIQTSPFLPGLQSETGGGVRLVVKTVMHRHVVFSIPKILRKIPQHIALKIEISRICDIIKLDYKGQGGVSCSVP